MGYRLRGAQGQVTSWGSANFNSTLLSRCKPMRFDLSIEGEEAETTALAATTFDGIPGLLQWGAELEGYALAAPVHGSVGVVALTSGSTAYTTNVDAWTLQIRSTRTHDITDLRTSDGSALPEWRSFCPDYCQWGGSWTCYANSATAIQTAHSYKTHLASSDTRPTAKFTYGNGATPESLSGKIQVTGVRLSARRGELQPVTVTFRGIGDLTPAGTASMFGSTAFGVPLWSEGGSATGAMVLSSLPSSRTFTGVDSFWEEINLSCAMDQAMMVNIRVKGSGSLTPA